MNKHNVRILGVADTRGKGTGTKEIHKDFVFTWSGVSRDQRAVHGVGFIIHPDKAKDIMSIEPLSERLIKISI